MFGSPPAYRNSCISSRTGVGRGGVVARNTTKRQGAQFWVSIGFVSVGHDDAGTAAHNPRMDNMEVFRRFDPRLARCCYHVQQSRTEYIITV